MGYNFPKSMKIFSPPPRTGIYSTRIRLQEGEEKIQAEEKKLMIVDKWRQFIRVVPPQHFVGTVNRAPIHPQSTHFTKFRSKLVTLD